MLRFEYISFSANPADKLSEANILCLGNFDGVHLAHRALMQKAKDLKEQIPGSKCGVLCFREPSTDFLIFPPPAHICTLEQKIAYVREEGMDFLVLADFLSIRDLSAERFVRDVLLDQLHCVGAVCGYNYRFGKGGSGNADTLRALLSAPVSVLEEMRYGDATVSSTRIRALIAKGDVENAALLLSHPYTFCAPVEHGKKLGRRLGIPTVNQSFPIGLQIPANGVYVTDCRINGTLFRGVTNVGNHPTVDCKDTAVNCETFLLDFSGDLYGKDVQILFLKYLRPEQKFENTDALCEQVAKDIAFAKAYRT